MANIRLTDQTKIRLERLGVMGETHDQLLSRIIGVIESNPIVMSAIRAGQTITVPIATPHRRIKRGSITSVDWYEPYIVDVLNQSPNQTATTKEVLRKLETMIVDKLKIADLEKLNSGEVRWKNKVMWCRKAMVDKGLLETKANAGHGFWKLIGDQGK